MRSMILAAMMVATIAHADEGKDTISKAKVNADKLTKEWSLTAVSSAPGHDSGKSTEVIILLRFEKDVTGEVLVRVKKAVEGQVGGRVPVERERDGLMWVYFLDADNVVVHKHHIRETKGEVTGKAGDAFRVVTDCDDDVIEKVKRIELRTFKR